jgi:hypothetical protein
MIASVRAAAAFWLVLGCLVGPAATAANATLDLGQGHTAEVDPAGVVRIVKGEAAVVERVFIGTWLKGKFVDQLKAIRIAGDRRPDGLLVRSGTIPRPGESVRYELFVRAAPADADGLRDLALTYVVESSEFADPKAKAAVLVRLPAAAYAGRKVAVDGVVASVLPEKPKGKPTLAHPEAAHDVTVRADKEPVLFVGRRTPGEILVQDARKWGSDTYEAQFHFGPTRSRPSSVRVVHLLLSLSDARGPTVARFHTNRPPHKDGSLPAVPRYGRFEAVLDLWARYANAYDATDIRVVGRFVQPDETTREVRGFFYQDFERALHMGKEKLTPVGPPDWRVRFTPTQLGRHSFTVSIRTKTGTHTTEPQSFHVVESKAPGFVGTHRKNPRYFQFTNGETYFLVGHNVCWGSEDKLSYDYDTFFRRMSHAGENYTRVWMCSWDTSIEGRRLDSYRLDAAWRLDYVLALAEQRGIYVKLCFDNEHDYQTPEKRKFFGIWKENGGPCRKVLEFFTLAEARAAYRRRLDYILARWGASPRIMAWELWNEMNYIASTDPKARDVLVNWTEEMAGYLKKHDPYKHLVTTSLGLHTVWNELWRLEDIDFTQIHAYLPRPDQADRPDERDAVLAVLRAGERVAPFGKPYHVSEFGYLDLPNVTRTNEKDPTGIHLRNAIWGGLFSGAAGTPAIWWWDDYVHERNLYKHYASAAAFLHDLDPADAAWTRMVAAGSAKVRVLGVKKRDAAALWLQREGNHWYRRVAQEKPLEPLGKVKVRVPDLEPGAYRVTWWDTAGGEITHYAQRTAPRRGDPATHDLVLEYTTGHPDIAVKVRRID